MVKVKVVSKLTDKGYPVHNKRYPSAHEAASKAEKKADPKTYKKSIKLERKMLKKDPHELMAKHTKSGKIEVERKYAKDKKLKKDLILHERVEARKEKK